MYFPRGSGPGYARNVAVAASHGEYLCFSDADDIMVPQRVEKQLAKALEVGPTALIGSNMERFPEGSTPRMVNWINGLTEDKLMTQRFRDTTVYQPTWFTSRDMFNRVGGYSQLRGEDLDYLYTHVERGGVLTKVAEPLVRYHYHDAQLSHVLNKTGLMRVRVRHFEQQILDPSSPFHLPNWAQFTIWGGRTARTVYRALSPAVQPRVQAFCDIAEGKAGSTYMDQSIPHAQRRKIPVVHWKSAKPPLLLCVSLDRTDGEFEANLASLNLREGIDYFQFT